MNQPMFVSVIIPVYNGADCLAEAIESVLNQTYQNFEIIIVDDGSTDTSRHIVREFFDSRIIYIENEVNRGADAARNIAIKASKGEILFFLDQDDIFHPEKLMRHVDYLSKHPEIGFTYNARIEFFHSSRVIRRIWKPPNHLTLIDILLSHQLSPSDMVIRREWAYRIGLWDEEHPYTGSEMIFLGHLYLTGCKFASIERALNFRRFYSGRVFSNLYEKCISEQEARDKIFSDPRCPREVTAFRDASQLNNVVIFAYLALSQNETRLGQEFLRRAIRFKPTIIEGEPCELISDFVNYSVEDESADHEGILKRIIIQLPDELKHLSNQCSWAIARGYLIKGGIAILWGRIDFGKKNLEKASAMGMKIDEQYIQFLVANLLKFEMEFGFEETQAVFQRLSQYLTIVGDLVNIHNFVDSFYICEAQQSYFAEKYAEVPKKIIRATLHDPKVILNRGMGSIFFRSFLKIGTKFFSDIEAVRKLGNHT
jgi:glycosyltransferase involved in cell wall biosynthesis